LSHLPERQDTATTPHASSMKIQKITEYSPDH